MHEWRVVGPWWTWPRATDPFPRGGARATSPVLQKYADSRLAERFLQDPQDSLRFVDDEDRYRVDRVLNRPMRIVDPTSGRPRLRRAVSMTTPVRKLYRDVHQRFYLVACSVHCDRPGLPRAKRDDILRAEFVIRRRRRPPPPRLEARQRLEIVAGLDAALRAEVVHQQQIAQLTAELTGTPVDDEIVPTLAATARAADAVAIAKAHVVGMSGWTGAEVVERWATGLDGEAATWRAISDGADDGRETTYPLYPLVAPDGDLDHDGGHGSIWFGLVPTGSDETEPDGTPRFGSSDDYEIRCVVHRRNPACPHLDDHAIEVWSEPTERYRLAPHTDALGLANRPVTLPAPDLAQLKAQTQLHAPGRLSSARIEQADDSRYSFQGDDGGFPTGASRVSGDEVCFFAIPLITFVAMFLLQIFLPVLLFLMNLWWMLQLKFCIPPSVSFDADLSAGLLPGRPSGFELDAVVDFDVELDQAERDQIAAAIEAQLRTSFSATATARILAAAPLQEQWHMLRNLQLAQTAAAAGTLRTGGAIIPVDRVEWDEVALR